MFKFILKFIKKPSFFSKNNINNNTTTINNNKTTINNNYYYNNSKTCNSKNYKTTSKLYHFMKASFITILTIAFSFIIYFKTAHIAIFKWNKVLPQELYGYSNLMNTITNMAIFIALCIFNIFLFFKIYSKKTYKYGIILILVALFFNIFF